MIPRRILLAYGFPGLPLALLGLPLYVLLPSYYADELGLGLSVVGAVLLLARATDIVTDPLAGLLSDNLPLAGHRRKSWMALGAPLLLVGLWQLCMPPPVVGAGHLLGWSLVTYLGWTLVSLPYLAWGAELSGDYHQRSRVTAAREGWVLVGTIAALAAVAVAYGRGGSTGDALAMLAVLVTLMLPLSLFVAFRVAPDAPAMSGAAASAWRSGLRLMMQNRAFLRLLAAWLLNGIANALPATLFLLFVTYRIDAPSFAGLLLVAYFAAALVALPAWLALARRFGKHRVWTWSMLWACAVFVWVPFLGPGDEWWFLAVCVLTGLSLGCDTALPAAIQADVLDEDTAAGGGQRAGVYFGIWGMATKAALALAVGIAFPLLALFGFETGTAVTPGASTALALLYGFLPVAFKFAATALVWNFPLNAARQAMLRRRITAEGWT